MTTTDTAHPAALLRTGRRRRRVGAIGAAAFVMSIGSFAAAAVISTNEVQSTFELTDCLEKTESGDGADFDTNVTDNYYIDFDSTSTELDPVTNVAVLHETLTVRAPAGFITKSTDTFTVDANACGYDFNVRLVANATNTFGEAAVPVVADWADKGVLIYLSKVVAPGDDFSNATDWDQAPLTVNSAGVVVNAATGAAVLTDNSTLTIGFQLNGGSITPAPVPALDPGELNFQVEFVPVP